MRTTRGRTTMKGLTTTPGPLIGRSNPVTKFKALAAIVIAALAIAVGGLAAPPTASAAYRVSCAEAKSMAETYQAVGAFYYSIGRPDIGSYYYGMAAGLFEAACY
jgi:hypothetical protein